VSTSSGSTSGVPRDSDPAGQPQPWPPPEPAPVSGGMIAGMIVLALLVPLIGPAIALIVGAAQIRRKGALALVWTGGILLAVNMLFVMMTPAFLIAAPNFAKIRIKSHEAETNMNLHAIGLTLERYGVDNEGVFPHEIGHLHEYKYFQERPYRCANPMTGEEMRQVSFNTEPCVGEYTYIPVEVDGEVRGYYLLAYGYESTPGRDVDGDGEPDHVIKVLCSWAHDGSLEVYVPATWDGQLLPPLEELLGK